MYQSTVFEDGGYRYLPSVFQYSAGIAAEPGFELVQARFKELRPINEAFNTIEQYLKRIGRPLTSFAHCELRSPKQFDDQGFINFNQFYVSTLEKWGIYCPPSQEGVFINPVARTNVCPQYLGPSEVCMYSFAYAVPSTLSLSKSFILSGGGDARPGSEPYRKRIIAYGDASEYGMRLKIEFVVDEMHRRLKSLGFEWADVTTVQAYSVHNIGTLVEEIFARQGLMSSGINWYFARPPVLGLDFEMDLRGSVNQIFI